MILHADAARAIELITREFKMPTRIEVCTPLRSVSQPLFIVYLDACTSAAITDREIMHAGVRNSKDYRKLREIMRSRLRSAAWDLKDLAEESLLRLGHKK